MKTDDSQALNRVINLPLLIMYGLGTMVGGGFYALLGKVAGECGMLAPLALGLSGLFALLPGLGFAELASRYPVSAGEARYVAEGFKHWLLPRLTGGLVILTGVVSAAALSVATIGFLQDFVAIPAKLGILLLVVGMGAVAAWGVGESVGLVTTITLIEVGALVYVVFVADWEPQRLLDAWRHALPNLDGALWISIFSASFLAFYAFIGFEDMVNMAEEVKQPRRTTPIAIIVSIFAATLLYVIVSAVAVTSVSPSQLAASRTPLAEVVKGHGWFSETGLGIASLLSGFNGALVQIVMASRVAYGMAQRGEAPRWLGKVNPRTRTPLHSTCCVVGVILALALFFPLTTLAKATSAIMLIIFAAVNLSLWRIKRRDPDLDGVGPRLPNWAPLAGAASCLLVLAFQLCLAIF